MDKLPREKLIEDGPHSLSDAELLAVMLGTGNGHESVFGLSERLIKEYGFERLCQMGYEKLSEIEGIKKAKATKLMAVFEIVRRIAEERNNRTPITTSKELYMYVKNDYILADKEILTVIYTDSSCHVLKKESYTDDNYTRISLPIREILKKAIDAGCYGIFLVHNHPAGNPNPSEADRKYTYTLEYSLKACDILLLDHIIIAGDSYYSFCDELKNKNFL